jgi:hypothetical protein
MKDMAKARRPSIASVGHLRHLTLRHLAIVGAAVIALALVGLAVVKMGRDSTEKDHGLVDGWVELIPQIDPVKNAVAGTWQRRSDELSVGAEESARLLLPPPPGQEYDLEVQFTRTSGTHSIALIFVDGSGQATFEVDAWDAHLAGIQMIRGSDLRENGTNVTIPPLENGRVYTALVQVRSDRVEGYLDGKLLATYRGDGSDLSMLELWNLPDSKRLGIGAYHSATTFHQVRVRSRDRHASSGEVVREVLR